jgi:hypothetical protein
METLLRQTKDGRMSEVNGCGGDFKRSGCNDAKGIDVASVRGKRVTVGGASRGKHRWLREL